jgi:sec-independent protein translocase protein TatA
MFRNPTTDLIVVLLIVLLIFGPKRLPGLGKQLGQGIRDFKDSITGNDDADDDAQRPAIPPASVATPPTAAPPETAPVAAPPASAPAAERESAEIGSERRP